MTSVKILYLRGFRYFVSPMSYDSEQQPHPDPSPTVVTNDNTIAPGDKPKRSKHLREVEAEGLYLWQISKHYLNHPAAAGGLLGISIESGLSSYINS